LFALVCADVKICNKINKTGEEVSKLKKILLFAAVVAVCLALMGGTDARAEERVEGELLLTVVPPADGCGRGAYLMSIALAADAVIVKVYDALSLTPDDPLMMAIRSSTLGTDEMLSRLADDERVLSATPNRILRLRKPNL
jgi:hypothetical protein